MTWTADEQRSITQKVLGSWPTSASTMGREGIAAYVAALQDRGLDADRVARAIDTWPAGSDFPPSAPNLAAAALKDPGVPTFDEMVLLIFGPGGVLLARGPHVFDRKERELLREDAMLRRAAGMHPVIGAFIRSQGIAHLVALDLNDDEFGQARRAQLRVAWVAFSEAHAGREVASLVSARRGELGCFDPLAALDTPFAPRQLGSGSGA
jgi:hypothetical protein